MRDGRPERRGDHRRAAEERDEIPPWKIHSITSPATQVG
jgi:hypothetical protein